jgi:hypothetical protein
MEAVASDVEVMQDSSQPGSVVFAAPHPVHDGGVQGFEQILDLHGVETEVLKVPYISDRIVTKEDEIALLVQIHAVHEIDDVLNTVCVVCAEWGREASSNLGRRFSKRNYRGFAKVEAVGTALHKLRVDQVGVLSDAEMAGADKRPPLITVNTWCNVRQIPRVERGDADFGDLVVGALVGLDVNANEDYVLVEVVGCGQSLACQYPI